MCLALSPHSLSLTRSGKKGGATLVLLLDLDPPSSAFHRGSTASSHGVVVGRRRAFIVVAVASSQGVVGADARRRRGHGMVVVAWSNGTDSAMPTSSCVCLMPPTPVSMSTVSDLRGLAASSLDLLKRRLDALHGDSVRDLEASHSRISKRIKMQTQSCLQLAKEAEKKHKKMIEKISWRAEEMKASYKKFVADVQSSTARACKVTGPEMAKSVERAIDGLRTRLL